MAGILEKWLGIDVVGDDQLQPAVRIRRAALWAILFYTALAVAVVGAIGFKGFGDLPPDPLLFSLIIIAGTITLVVIGWIIRNAVRVFTASVYPSRDLEEEARTILYQGNAKIELGDEKDIGQYGKHKTLKSFLKALEEEYAKPEHAQSSTSAGGQAATFTGVPTAVKPLPNSASPNTPASPGNNPPAPKSPKTDPTPTSPPQGTTYLSQLEAHYSQLLQLRSLLCLNERNETFLSLLPLQVFLLSVFGISLALLLAQTQPLLAWSAITSAKIKSAEFASTFPLLQGVFIPANDSVIKGCTKDTNVAVIILNVTLKDNAPQAELVSLDQQCFNQRVTVTKNDGTLSAMQKNVLQKVH